MRNSIVFCHQSFFGKTSAKDRAGRSPQKPRVIFLEGALLY